jgi:hypothetical protein
MARCTRNARLPRSVRSHHRRGRGRSAQTLSASKIRVTSILWEDAKVIGKHEVLEVRNVDDRLHIARKARRPDEWDPPIEPRDPYGPGAIVTRHAGNEVIDD